jgi:nucleoid DNA-binding protein
MAVKSPQFLINIRKNENSSSAAYGKYYLKAVEKETISLRGLCQHMAEHNSLYGRDVIEGVLTKMVSCMIHLIAEGNPIKLDGLGIFYPTVESTKNVITKPEILAG